MLGWAALAAAGALVHAAGSAADEPDHWAVTLDNDALTGSTRDRDYTAGFSAALTGAGARRIARPNYRALEWLDRRTGIARVHRSDDAPDQADAVQATLLIFTPDDIANPDLVPTDRPYANVAFLEHSHYGLDADRRVMHESRLAVGMLGSPLAEAVQRSLHELIRDAEPRGYRHQVSDGGELTARYVVARHALLAAAAGRRAFDAHYTLEGSVGFLTEAAAGVGLRWGAIRSPWWSAARTGSFGTGVAAPTFDGPTGAADELYMWAGVTLRARFYNAFLQGQWRDSALTFGAEDLERFVLEAGIGVTRDFGRVQLTYALRYQTPELQASASARPVGWAGVTITGNR